MTEKENMMDGPTNPAEDHQTTPPVDGNIKPEETSVPPIFGPKDVEGSAEAGAELPQEERSLGADEPVDVNKIAEDLGIKDQLDSLPEDAKNIFIEPVDTLCKETNEDDIFSAAEKLGLTGDKLETFLRNQRGFTDEQIEKVFKDGRREKLPKEKPQEVKHDLTEPEAVEEMQKEKDKLEETVKKVEDGDMSEEDAKVEIDKTKGKIHEWLFNGDNGLLRPEHRVRRLAVKPTVSILLAIMVMYIAALSAITKGSAKKVGH